MSSIKLRSRSGSASLTQSQSFDGSGTLVALSTVTAAAAIVGSASNFVSPASQNESAASAQGTVASKKAAARVALHASLGVDAAMVDAIEAEGVEAWLDRQIRTPNDSTSADFFAARGLDLIDAKAHYRNDPNFDPMIWSQLFTGGNSVRKRMALALSEIFVVSLTGLDLPWKAQAVGAYWDTLNANAFANFRDLLEAVTLSPAMGAYLNTRGNRAHDPVTGRVPDENYAREIMQLFTIGLVQLNPDGTPILRNGSPIETYTNTDVEGLAKVFTGFDLDYRGVTLQPSPVGGAPVPEVHLVRQPMTSNPSRWLPPLPSSTHSLDEKKFLGSTIREGVGPQASLRRALNVLARHPNVGPFFSKQLIQRLVTSNPSPDYVFRVASIFNNNGRGIRGDLSAVFKAIILDPEATDESSIFNPFFGKIREPMMRFAQWGRTFGATSTSGAWSIRNLSEEGLLNQSPFRSPSVFNFFRPDYISPRSHSMANNMTAPELQIMTDRAAAGYVNFINRTVMDIAFWYVDIKPNYSHQLDIAHDPIKLIDNLDLILTAGQLSQFTRGIIFDVIKDIPVNGLAENQGRLQRVREAVILIMCSNEYIVQK